MSSCMSGTECAVSALPLISSKLMGKNATKAVYRYFISAPFGRELLSSRVKATGCGPNVRKLLYLAPTRLRLQDQLSRHHIMNGSGLVSFYLHLGLALIGARRPAIQPVCRSR